MTDTTDNYGTTNNPVVDSNMNYEEAVLKNLAESCPDKIIGNQALVPVLYYSFDDKLHKGQVVIDKRLTKDIEKVFELILKIKFPIESVIPISHRKFLIDGKWDDELSMQANNTSAFNYRRIVGTTKLSNHAYGFAIDINPRLNPYFIEGVAQPKGATYDEAESGTITSNHPIVARFKELGWGWGGEWDEPIDYQHFEKNLNVYN